MNETTDQQSDLKEALVDLQKLNEELGNEKIQLNQAFHPFLNVISGLQTELAAAALDHGEAQAEISKRKIEANKAKGEMKQCQNENFMLAEQLSYAEQTIADLTESVRKLDDDNGQLQRQNQESDRTNAALSEELRLAKNELETCAKEIDNLSDERKDLRSKKLDLEMEVEETKQRLQQRGEDNRRLDMDKDFLERNLLEANHAMGKMMMVQKETENELGDLKSKLGKEKEGNPIKGEVPQYDQIRHDPKEPKPTYQFTTRLRVVCLPTITQGLLRPRHSQ